VPSSSTIRARPPKGPPATASVDTTPDAIAAHLEDAAHFPGGHAEGIARPHSEAEVADLLRQATRVLPVGAQSSVTGGATPNGGLVLSTERLNQIEDTGSSHVRAGAGVPLAVLEQHLRARGKWFPPVPTFMGAFVGGVVATNAAGAATFKYGSTRAWVDGLTVVLPCGDVLDISRSDITSGRDGFSIVCAHGTRHLVPGHYRLPSVPKCSAGYYAAPEMDLIDLFIGAEGTLGVIADATLRILPAPPAVALALVPMESDTAWLPLVDALRRASQQTWAQHDRAGIDVCAIEYLDRRCLQILREDGVDRRNDIALPEEARVALLVQIELPAGTDASHAFDQVAAALEPDAADSPLGRFCRTLDEHGALADAELAMPGDARRAGQLLAFREGAPAGVNQRVGAAKRTIDERIEKTAADMIVPFERFGEMMEIYRDGFERLGLDFAIWGHVSDGNVHPNAIPRSYEDVMAGKRAILEFGRHSVRLGGCPLAEHGVGRNPIKQQLLRDLYGSAAVEEMRAVKRTLDPDWKLAPGVLFDRD
jgi:D-lactate dehydrogenase (cytochrome)